MNEELEQWEAESQKTPVNVNQITDLVKQLEIAKKEYEAKKADSTNAEKIYKGLRMDVLAILKEAGQTKFFAEGVGTVSITNKLSVKTPKTPEAKKALLGYFEDQGEDAYLTYVTVNSASLNSYFNMLTEEFAKNGEIFELPGVEAPTLMENISFRKG